MNGWNRIDVFNILANPFTTTRPRVTLGERKLFTQIDEPFSDKFGLADVNLSYDLGGGKTFSAISSYIDRKVDVLRDATALTASITGGSIALPANIYTLDDATRARPLALIDAHRITQVDARAAAAGVQSGAKRATALALAPDLVLGQADAARDALALQAVGHAALAFTPMVCIESTDSAGTPTAVVLPL
jgi:hypothetical protein